MTKNLPALRLRQSVVVWLVVALVATSGCELVGILRDAGGAGDPSSGTARPDAAAAVGSSDSAIGEACGRSGAACAPTHYCAAESNACRPRCDAAGLCVGPAVLPEITRIASDGTQVCYVAPDPEAPGGGAHLWAWGGGLSSPRQIADDGDVKVLYVADGYCYFAAPSLKRALLSGASEPVVVQERTDEPKRAWLTTRFAYWTSGTDTETQIFRLARSAANAVPELLARSPAHHDWEAGNERSCFGACEAFRRAAW